MALKYFGKIRECPPYNTKQETVFGYLVCSKDFSFSLVKVKVQAFEIEICNSKSKSMPLRNDMKYSSQLILQRYVRSPSRKHFGNLYSCIAKIWLFKQPHIVKNMTMVALCLWFAVRLITSSSHLEHLGLQQKN